MTAGTEPRCWNCRYFDRDWSSDDDGGFCRRYPPHGLDDGVSSVFPGVDYMDWCGEFQPKEDD